MENASRNIVVNTHWYKDVEHLPPNTVYIGRPSKWGNPYSSKTGKYTREECIALHLIDVYRTAKRDKSYMPMLREELDGHDLACWCKQPKKIVGCHGDNFLHVLSDRCKERLYDKSVIHYLMDDIRTSIEALRHRIMHDLSTEDFLSTYVCFSDMHLNVANAIKACRERDISFESIEYLLARFFVHLQLARQDIDLVIIEYRLMYICWLADVFVTGHPDLFAEPMYPGLPLKRSPKRKTST